MKITIYNPEEYFRTGKRVPEVIEQNEEELFSAMQIIHRYVTPAITTEKLYEKLEALDFNATSFEWEQFLATN